MSDFAKNREKFVLVFEFLIAFLTGIAVFLFGMKIMSDGLERAAGNKMRTLFGKISNNRFVGLGVGTAVTAIIHSSAATTVMAISFVNAGMMTMIQAANIIMGANIGTTVTGLLIALDSLNMALYMTIPAFIGVFMMLVFKKENIKKIGTILAGVGIIFVGLNLMGAAVDMVEETSFFAMLFEPGRSPIVLMLIGIVVTAIFQSSTAVNALIILLVVPYGSGQMGLGIVDGLYIILGTNVGTCITALIASIGTSTNAKRTSMFHLLFNVIGTVVFALIFLIIKAPNIAKIMGIFGDSAPFQIAWFNFFQNLICALMILPFTKYVVKLTEILIKDKPVVKTANLIYVDPKSINNAASIAITQILQEVKRMAELAKYNYVYAMDGLLSLSSSKSEEILSNEKLIDNINIGLTDILVKMSGHNVTEGDKKLIGSLYHVISDIERIGDHNVNILEFTTSMNESNAVFSDMAIAELKDMYIKILEMFVAAMKVFENRDESGLAQIDAMEEEIDGLREKYSVNHVERLDKGLCSAESGMIFYGILTDLERIADHLTNIAFSIKPRKLKNGNKPVKSSKAAAAAH